MTSLVEELQRESLDPSSSVSSLLRKVKLVAVKLKPPDVVHWVEFELNGYEDNVPDYRVRSGDPRWFNPYHSWAPIMGAERIMSIVRTRSVFESVNHLRSAVETGVES